MEHGWKVIILILALIYEVVICPRICKRMILRHISSMGGEVYNIERLTLREFLYCVDYWSDGKTEKAIVEFDLFYRSTWR